MDGRFKNTCRHCVLPVTWADQRKGFGRLVRSGMKPAEVKAFMPACDGCVRTYLRTKAGRS